jgi:Sortase domain
MRIFIELLRSRVVPAFIAALGVSVITAGLLTYTNGTDTLGPITTPTLIASDAPSLSPTFISPPGPSTAPIAAATPIPLPTGPGTAVPVPSSSGGGPSAGPLGAGASGSSPANTPAPGQRVATRVVIPALNIDLPVVKPPDGLTTFPLCNVAQYLQNLSQPGEPGATYIYAHARVGMFLPILDASLVNNGKAMIGMLVQVYTSDDRYFLYEITQVRRHQLTLADAIVAKDEELWLQTSEGPRGTLPKVQLVALPLSSGPADDADAHPKATPVVCA